MSRCSARPRKSLRSAANCFRSLATKGKEASNPNRNRRPLTARASESPPKCGVRETCGLTGETENGRSRFGPARANHDLCQSTLAKVEEFETKVRDIRQREADGLLGKRGADLELQKEIAEHVPRCISTQPIRAVWPATTIRRDAVSHIAHKCFPLSFKDTLSNFLPI